MVIEFAQPWWCLTYVVVAGFAFIIGMGMIGQGMHRTAQKNQAQNKAPGLAWPPAGNN